MGAFDNAFGLDDAAQTGNESLIAQQLRLQSRKADLEREAASIADQGQPRGQMVSGHYVAPSLAQQLSPVVGQALNKYQRAAVSNELSMLDRRVAAAASQHLSSQPGPDATPQQKMEWAARGAQIPTLAPVMKAYMQDQMVNEPARQESRQDKKDAQTAALTQKREQQDAELAYRRDRDQQRAEDNQANRDLRATLAAAVHSAGGGDKASNYQIVGPDKDGYMTRVNKLTGETVPLGPVGRQDSAITKAQQEAARQQGSSQDALKDIAEAKKLLPNATGSGVGAAVDMLYRGVGATNDGMKANRALKVLSGRLTMSVPRFEGPQSDKDVQTYKEQAADVGNESLTTSERLAALKQVEAMHNRTLKNAPRNAAAASGKGPSIRDAVEAAAQQHSSDAPKVRTYNPATGRLE